MSPRCDVIPRGLSRISSFRRMPESSGAFVDTGLRQRNVMLLILRPLAAGFLIVVPCLPVASATQTGVRRFAFLFYLRIASFLVLLSIHSPPINAYILYR
jgi:hypothetical protein